MKKILAVSAVLLASCASSRVPSSKLKVDVVAEPPQQQSDADLFHNVLLEHLPAGATNVSVLLTPQATVYAQYEMLPGPGRDRYSAYGRRMDSTKTRKDDFVEMSRYIAWDIEQFKDLTKKDSPPPAADGNSANIIVHAFPSVSEGDADVLRRLALNALSDRGPLTVVFVLSIAQPQQVQGSFTSFAPRTTPANQAPATVQADSTIPNLAARDYLRVGYIIYGASGNVLERGPIAAKLYADTDHEEWFQAITQKVAQSVASKH